MQFKIRWPVNWTFPTISYMSSSSMANWSSSDSKYFLSLWLTYYGLPQLSFSEIRIYADSCRFIVCRINNSRWEHIGLIHLMICVRTLVFLNTKLLQFEYTPKLMMLDASFKRNTCIYIYLTIINFFKSPNEESSTKELRNRICYIIVMN